MPLLEETVLPGDSLLTLPVVIIGEFFDSKFSTATIPFIGLLCEVIYR